MKTQIIIAVGFVLLVGCTTVPRLPEASVRLSLAEAGIELLPPGVDADTYLFPHSFLEQESNGFFRLYIRDQSLTNITVLSKMPISGLTLDCPKLMNLAPLSEIPLKRLGLTCHPDADLSFVRGKPLHSLDIAYMRVRDLSMFKGMPLEKLWFNPSIVTNGLDFVVSSPRLDLIVTCTSDDNRKIWSKKTFLAKLHLWGFRPDSAAEPPTTAAILSEPFSLCMTTYAGFTSALMWEFTLQTNRQAVLMVDNYGERSRELVKRTKNMLLSVEQLAAVKKIITENQFFTLETHYGDDIIDASSRALSVRIGDYQKTILIRHFNNRLVANDDQLESAKQLLKIWETLIFIADIPEGCLDWTEDDAKVLEWKSPNKALEVPR